MDNKIILHAPVNLDDLEKLKAGDQVILSGVIYTGRDAAHKRMVDLIKEGKSLPIELKNQAIFYVAPSPTKPGRVIGSAGPTTSARMDSYTPVLLDLGLKVMIGKGPRSEEVIKSIKKNKAVYLAGIGGAAALMSHSIKKAEVVDFSDLGTEAIHRLEVENMTLIVAIDSRGNDLYKIRPEKFKRK